MKTMPTFVLEAVQLAFDYDGIQALRGMSLGLRQGRKLALLGANGSGKTTFLLHLNGILRPRQGEIRLRGKACGYGKQDLLNWRRQVGLVFQNPDDQIFAATVAQDVSFGPLNLGLSEDEARLRVAEALLTMDIAGLADRPTHQLSFGQKKRVAIAGAIAMHPDVLLLDEPTAGLDPCGTQALLTALDTLQAFGTAIVLATHDMDLAYTWADELTIIHEGRVLVESVTPDALLRHKNILAATGLCIPAVLEIAGTLAEEGVLPANKPFPRTANELCARIKEKKQRFS